MDPQTQKLDIKKKIECIDREIQLLQASHSNIVGQINQLSTREKLNTEQIQDNSNLKQSHKDFSQAFNKSLSTINEKLQNYDTRLLELSTKTDKTLSEYKVLFESLITNQKIVSDKEIFELKSKLDKDMSLIQTEISDQRGHINSQIDLKTVNINSHLSSHTSTLNTQMQNLDKKMLELQSELKTISNSLTF